MPVFCHPFCRIARTLLRQAKVLRAGVSTTASSLRVICVALTLMYTLGVYSPPAAVAQASTTFATPAALSGLVQAPDGNFYGVTIPQPYNSCSSYQSNRTGFCGAIYKITPTGDVSLLHTFAVDGSEGYDPNPLVVGPDGSLYGTTQGGGSISGCGFSGCGTFFKLSFDGKGGGSFKIVHFFTDAEVGYSGGNQLYTINLGRAILGDDGSFYQTAAARYGTNLLFKISTSGTFQAVGVPNDSNGAMDGEPVQGTDGNFYGSIAPGGSLNVGSVYSVTRAGAASIIASFPYDNNPQGYRPNSLVQGADGNFFGFTTGNPTAYPYDAPAGLFQVTAAGGLKRVATTNSANQFVINAPPLSASDGNLYIAPVTGGDSSTCSGFTQASPLLVGCGALLQVTPAGAFKTLHTFQEGADGQFPQGTVFQASDGTLLVAAGVYTKASNRTASSGVLYSLNLNLPAPVQLSFTDANGAPINGSIQPGVPLTLNYKVPGAFSLSASQCYAFVQGNIAAAGTWTGRQSGTTDATGFHGSAQVTPTADGTYTYALTCGGTTSGFVTLNLSSKLQITTSSLSNGSVGKSYSNPILLEGGISPFKFVADGLPPGITIDPTTGYLSGKPTQFGTYQTTIAVQDSSTPALTAGKFLPLTIDSSLMLSGSLKNANVGTQYTGGLTAGGGYGTYKWTVSAGSLPEGLTLNATTGVIAGKPTKAETAKFSITVTDGENPVASVTLATSLSTVAPPLIVTAGDFEACTVGVLCEGQFDATGGMPPYTWTVAAGATLPTGMTISANGEYSFKPLQYYDLPFQIEVQVTDSSKPALTATGIDSLVIASSLKASPYTLPIATVGQAYAAPAPAATGGVPPYTWALLFSDFDVKREYGANADGSLYSPAPKTAGTYTVTYVLKDSEKNQAVVQFPATLTVVTPLIPTTTTLSSSNSTAGSGMNVTLTAQVGKSTGVPTGRVTFYSGPTSLGTAMLDATGSASLVTAFRAAGTYSVSAQYSGDATSGGSISAALVETVVTPAVTGTASPGSLTIDSGSSGSLVLTLTATGGYAGTATFKCGTLPAHFTCSFAPPSVTLSSVVTSASTTLTVRTGPGTTSRNDLPLERESDGTKVSLAGVLGCLMLCSSRRSRAVLRRNGTGLLLLLLSGMVAVSVSGCGSDSPNASPGTYAIPVTVDVGGAAVQTVNVSVVVKRS